MSENIHPDPIQPNPNSETTKIVFCILSYISFLFIIGLIADFNDKKIRFHANQGLILFLFESSFLMLYFITVLGLLGGILSVLATLVFIIMGIINVVNNEEKKLPLIGKFQLL